jgi:hypothetical protein
MGTGMGQITETLNQYLDGQNVLYSIGTPPPSRITGSAVQIRRIMIMRIASVGIDQGEYPDDECQRFLPRSA